MFLQFGDPLFNRNQQIRLVETLSASRMKMKQFSRYNNGNSISFLTFKTATTKAADFCKQTRPANC